MNNKRMVKIVVVVIIVLIFTCIYLIYYWCQTPTYLVSYLSQTPLKSLIHYEWDISKTSDKSLEATLKCEDNQIILKVFGNGEMIDFDSNESQIAWHMLQTMETGWYLQPNEVKIDNGITYIGKYAFSDYTLLEIVYLPASLEKIGKYSFLNCTALHKVVFAGTIGEWNMIECEDGWNRGSSVSEIECIDGIVKLN